MKINLNNVGFDQYPLNCVDPAYLTGNHHYTWQLRKSSNIAIHRFVRYRDTVSLLFSDVIHSIDDVKQ